ncbi:SusC/RagA family TonB-linked outer membrane protein [Ekhidna sp.]|uniref:SusC/RagA family TonB-linked outer membrane protein n=1 Tax=Ekhidna sp. TaxID=2608089 RepID=UPI003B514B10
MKKFFFSLIVCLFAVAQVHAQRTVSGKVTDDTGEALPGVNVVIKGTTNGTTTDLDGNYRLQVQDNTTLVFSFVGFETQEINIGGRTTIDVTMGGVTELQEVVVTGYGVQRKSDLTGAIAQVSGEELEDFPVPGVDQALQGRVAGVNVISSNGQPGGGVTVRIRGASSINSNNQPLYVIDGMPVESFDTQSTNQGTFGGFGGQTGNSLNQINFNDVASIEVLKDASATAIYGSRAANGVVLITTKRGKPGQAKVSATYSSGFTEVFDLPELLNAEEYELLHRESIVNAGGTPDDTFYGTDNTDWLGAIFRQARISQFNVSASGGSNDMSYFTSIQYDDQEGTLVGTNFERVTARLNLDANISDKVKIGSSLTFGNTKDNIQSNDNFIIGPYFSALRTRPDLPIYNDDGTFAPTNQFDNAVAATTYENTFKSNRFLGSFFAQYEVIDNLILKGTISVDRVGTNRDLYWPSTTLGGTIFGNVWIERGFDEQTTFNNTYTANYQFDINDDHRFNVLAGAEWQLVKQDQFSTSATGLPNDILKTLNSASTPINTDGLKTQWGLQSYFGRVNYGFNDRYLATLTVRTDGSSRFGQDNQFGFFPSVALGWNVMNESFFSVDAINNLKLRTSWGITGNHRVGNFASRGLFQGGFSYGGVGGTAPTQIANPLLKWEETAQLDFGIDFGLFQSRITGSIDYYVKKSTDILLLAPLPRSSGFNNVNQNIGEVENKGFEIELGGDVIYNDNFQWNITGNLAFNRNKVVSLVDGNDIQAAGFNQSIVREGEPIGAFYGWQVEGIFQTQEEIDNLNAGSSTGFYQTAGTSPGDLRFQDTNGDGVITADDRVITGSAQPDFIGGVTSTTTFKGLSLTAFFQFSQGNDIINLAHGDLWRMHNADNSAKVLLDRWTPSNTDGKFPRVVQGDPNDNDRNSSFFVEDGSYVRLKTLRLSYNLPQSILSDMFLSNVTFFAQGTNLLTITDYSGVDPEVNTFGQNNSTALGVDNNTYPGGKTYTFGVKVGF